MLLILPRFQVRSQSVEQLLDSAKTMFMAEKGLTSEELYQFSYDEVLDLLKQVVELDSNNAEARYFMGYTYSRINSRDGKSIQDMDLDLVLKASEQFEKVNEIEPDYKGQIIILDPFSKITAEWGSMAMKYWQANQRDSAVWAFQEGKRRGGFSDFILEVNRLALASCSDRAILISSGDNCTIPLWYLQIVEHYRTDVSVVDVSLLNAHWYPQFLTRTGIVDFRLDSAELDEISYIQWSDILFTIGDFSWTLKPSYHNAYLLRGDRLLLGLLQVNAFQREVYFSIGYSSKFMISLENDLQPMVAVTRLNHDHQPQIEFKEYYKMLERALKLTALVNQNSHDQLGYASIIRYYLLEEARKNVQQNKKKAKRLFDLLEEYADGEKYPAITQKEAEYVEMLKNYMD